MKISLISSIVLVSFILISCQRDADIILPPGVTGNLLVKSVRYISGDSTISYYTYDASVRLARILQIDPAFGTVYDIKIYRDASGIITRAVESGAIVSSLGIDSLVNIYHYNYATARYTSTVYFIPGSSSIRDSTVFSYDGMGNLVTAEHLVSYSGVPDVVDPRIEWTYSAAGNISSYKQYDYVGPALGTQLRITQTNVYDAKPAPLDLSQHKEGIVLFFYDLCNVNNLLSRVSVGGNNNTETYTHTYNSNDRPTVTTIKVGATTSVVIKYYYQ